VGGDWLWSGEEWLIYTVGVVFGYCVQAAGTGDGGSCRLEGGYVCLR
jgi:hypothetical protein